MSDKPYNEPAFPLHGAGIEYQYTGMSLRDYFAVKAMNALLVGPPIDEVIPGTADPQDKVAAASYIVTDAMLKARQS